MKSDRSYRFPFAKFPAVRLALLFAIGISLSKLTAVPLYFWVGMFGVILCSWLIAEYCANKSLQIYLSSIAIGLYLISMIFCGALWHAAFDYRQEPTSAKLLSAYTWETIEIKGTVENIKQTSTDKYQLDVAADSTVIEDSLVWLESYLLRAVYDPGKKPLPASIKLGNRLHFHATIYPLEAKSNPHEFDYREYLASQNIFTQVGIEQIFSAQPEKQGLNWHTLRRHALRLIENNFTDSTEPVAKALLMGYKNELDRDEKIAFSRVGLSHIMAVSGLHVGFIIAPFWLFIPFFWTFRYGKQVGLGLLIFALVFYAGITGFSASVTRAAITGGLLAYGKLFYKSRDSKNLTAVAAIIILLFDPNQLFEIGFQLSFAAVYIILLILPVIQQVIPNRIRFRWYSMPIMVVIVSFIVQVGLYPLLSYYFGEFSLVGPLANALIVPWLTLMVPYAIALLLLSIFWPAAGMILNVPCRWFLEFLNTFVTAASGWQWSWIQTPVTGIFIFLIWTAAIFLIASLQFSKLRWKILIGLLFILCLQQVHRIYQNLKPAKLKITMLDVGQGDAAFVRTPSGKNLLVDAGHWTPGYNSARYAIIPHLKALGVEKLDAVFLSHPHADHIGGIIELMNEMEIEAIYNSGFVYDSELYKNYIALARDRGITIKSMSAGESISIDPAMRMYIYGPSDNNHHSDPNERSLVMEFIYGKTEFLFTGDAGKAQEQLLLENFGSMIDTDFLKVGHHGSRTSSSVAFLQRTTPEYAAVSLGLNNKFSHPHREAIHRLSNSTAELIFTSLDGALIFESDGNAIKRLKWR